MSVPSEASSAPLLAVRDLVVTYGSRAAVRGVSFDVSRGEIFGLLGPNGAGKTSTLSAIEGLVRPDSGSIVLDGVDVRRDARRARASLGVQLQTSSFQPELSIEQIVQLYAGLYGVVITRSEIVEGMRAIGLGGELGKRFKTLSGGQQQRLALSIATIHRPALLLLDEPTAGLDPVSRRRLWGRIERLSGAGGGVVLTTHSMEEAQAVCHRVAIIDHGAVLALDTPARLIAQHHDDPRVLRAARGEVTLEDVFIGLTADGTDDD